MPERIKQLFDWDTTKVLGATSANLSTSAMTIDSWLKVVISILTILYVIKKLRAKKGNDE